MRCPKCGKDWPDSYRICPECVVPFTVTASGERSAAIGGDASGATFNMGDRINTGGGAGVTGNVTAGTFIGRDKIVFNVTWQGMPFVLPQPDLAQLRADYLAYLREAYQYLDFKGLPQVEKIAQQLPLDAVYVPLRARPETPAGETWLRVAGRAIHAAETPETPELVALAERGQPVEPVLADAALADAPGLVLLGDPGAGKSTLLKVIALALAREPEGPLPILVPLNAYADTLAHGDCNLHDFLVNYFATRQHCLRDLGPLFDAALQAGQAVILLDGLDEVQANRGFLVRLVQDFAAEHIPAPGGSGKPVPGNRLVVTSRIVGYREAPLNGARWRTYTLVDWERDEIEHFVTRWTLAFEEAVQGAGELANAAAARERDELLASIVGAPGIERLASNPLLLTILALIKRQGVTLPQRRVELYELYLRTLINAWNKARSLDQRPVGPELDYLETAQVLAPLGLWLRETNPTAGLVSRAALEHWLTAYYQTEWALPPGQARHKGREFLQAVQRYSNLLVERGQEQYGFLHLTFEEMLAAKGIAARAQLGVQGAVEVILRYLDDPAWHETILLAVGALGLVTQQPLAAGAVLCTLCNAPTTGETYGRPVVLAGEALLDVGEVGVGRKAAAQVTERLVQVMQDAAAPIRTRREAGLVLGKLDWQPEDLDVFVEIPAGVFLYGDKKEKRKIERPYGIGKYPVTNAQYARFVEAGGYENKAHWNTDGWNWRTGTYDSKAPDNLPSWLAVRPVQKRSQPFYWTDEKWNNPLFPVVGVTWFEAEAYCNWLSMRTTSERSYRLPTEVEWERAARGTEGRVYPWGNSFEAQWLNCPDAWAGRDLSDIDTWIKWAHERPEYVATTAVCTYPQGMSCDGVWDLSGNVWEWTASSWDTDNKVLRGGSWDYDGRLARCAFHGGNVPVNFYYYVGFRVVLSLEDSGS